MTIREYLKSIGATENELSAKVVARMEHLMMTESDLSEFKPDTVMKILKGAIDGLDIANNHVQRNIDEAEAKAKNLRVLIDNARIEANDLIDQTKHLSELKIRNPDIKDAVMAYAAILRATKEVFGMDSISAEVMCRAIEAGSYVAYRGVMGPKWTETEYNGRRKV